jgi:hypothetical protein
MGLFKSDLYRSFAIGFVLGAAALFAAMGSRADNPLAGQVIPSATAAPVLQDQTLVDPVQDAAR